MEFKGTKGEWTVSSSIEYTGEYSLVTKEGSATFGEDEYNAKLISAAPELLEALIEVTNELHNAIECINGIESAKINPRICRADKAIKKALGL